MRIAYVINSLEGGGAALPVPGVTRVMRDHGAEVAVYALTPRDRQALPAMLAAGLSVDIREGGEKDHLAAWRWLERKLNADRPDLVWTSLTRATLIGQQVGRRLGVPVVSWQHAAFLKPANRLLIRAMRDLTALWVADCTSVGLLAADRLALSADHLVVWPIFEGNPHTPQAQPWRQDDILRIGSIGRLHPVKGYDVLIEAVRLLRASDNCGLPPFEVLIAGEGTERATLLARIAQAGLDNVRLTGFVEPMSFLAGLHLYVQPSRSEGLGVAAQEAMQAGLPVLVSGVGELAHSMSDGITGLVVPPDDPVELSLALHALLSHPANLSRMGQAARARTLDRFGPQAFARAGAAVMGRLPAILNARGPVKMDRSPISGSIDPSHGEQGDVIPGRGEAAR